MVGVHDEDEDGDAGRGKDSIEELGRRLDGINPYVLGRRTRQVLDDLRLDFKVAASER